jgi:hypothetical protein
MTGEVGSNAYARARMLTRRLMTVRLQRRLTGVARRSGSRPLPYDGSAQVARELSRIDALLLNMLSYPSEHRGSNGVDNFAGVVATDSGNVAHSLSHSVVMIAEDLGKRRRALWIFRLGGGFAMDRISTAGIRVRRNCRSHQRNRGIHRALRNDWVDAEPLTHLLDCRVAYLLLNLFLN